MMFAPEGPIPQGVPKDSSPFTPPSPHILHDFSTPIKLEGGGYLPPSPALKLEPMSPSMRGRNPEVSPCGLMYDTYSPTGSSVNYVSTSSPMMSPLSPSSNAALSPTIKLGEYISFSFDVPCTIY